MKFAIKAARVKLDYDPADGGYISGFDLPDATVNVTVENYNAYESTDRLEDRYAHVDLIALIALPDVVEDDEPEDEKPSIALPDNVKPLPKPKGGKPK